MYKKVYSFSKQNVSSNVMVPFPHIESYTDREGKSFYITVCQRLHVHLIVVLDSLVRVIFTN